MTRLGELAAQPSRRVAGAISGTSMDGIDVAICLITGAGAAAKVKLESFLSVPYESGLSGRLRTSIGGVQDVAELNVLVAEAFASAITTAAGGTELDLVGSHGQTLYHHSRRPGTIKATLQVGDGDVLAERLGVLVASDFRARDIAAGGEGAPLTPYADFILFGGSVGTAVLNLGGIANLTILGSRLEDVQGFDTGPANAPLDRIARAEFGVAFDAQGARARLGDFDIALLNRLIQEDLFVSTPPPKSTGFEAYGDSFVEMLQSRSGTVGADLLRFATEFVVESIARQMPAMISEVILAGGGAANGFLRERLGARLAPRAVRLSDEHGVPYQAREAIAFAILANDALSGLPTSLPRVTGAKHARRLGKFSWP